MVESEPLASLTTRVSPGEIVAGKYRVERVLGVGGMGVVVSARHTTLDQVVAIKLLVANRFDSYEEAVSRFLGEARAAARIESDHVCRVFDVGTLESGVPFMVMEHLEGRDLDDEIQHRGQLDMVEACDYVMQAADALAAAHQLGIVHRDIKPANLFLAVRPDGTRRVKILDFGISKSGGDAARRTLDKTSLGTPAYMAPEQVRAASDVDARADIWSLGAILYELITGEMAFIGDDVARVLDHVLKDDPCPMSPLRRDLPAELESIVMRCLDRDPDGRWPSAATLARALAPFGSPNMFTALASVQRELGSFHSISQIRTGHLSSVQPMVANVRPSMPTWPEESERSQRLEIVQDWTKQRARKRTARVAVIALACMTMMMAAAAVVVRMAATSRGAESAAAASAPPQAESGLPVVAANADANAVEPMASASGSVRSASNPVQNARTLAPRAGATRGAGRPASKAAPRGSVNHLLDTRD